MFEPNAKYLKPDTQVSVTWNMVPKSSLCTHPKFSHLQQQNIQTRRAMMITPPSTARVIISVWKFTADKQEETQRQSYSGIMRRQVSCQASHSCRWTEVCVVFYKRWSVSDQLKTPDRPLHSQSASEHYKSVMLQPEWNLFAAVCLPLHCHGRKFDIHFSSKRNPVWQQQEEEVLLNHRATDTCQPTRTVSRFLVFLKLNDCLSLLGNFQNVNILIWILSWNCNIKN